MLHKFFVVRLSRIVISLDFYLTQKDFVNMARMCHDIAHVFLKKCFTQYLSSILNFLQILYICIFEHSLTIKIGVDRVNQEKRLVEFAG